MPDTASTSHGHRYLEDTNGYTDTGKRVATCGTRSPSAEGMTYRSDYVKQDREIEEKLAKDRLRRHRTLQELDLQVWEGQARVL